MPPADPRLYDRRVARLRATARWRRQVAALTSLQLVVLGEGVLAGVMADDASPVASDPRKALAAHRAAEQGMVRAFAFLAEARARSNPATPKEKFDA